MVIPYTLDRRQQPLPSLALSETSPSGSFCRWKGGANTFLGLGAQVPRDEIGYALVEFVPLLMQDEVVRISIA
jgi:hypothetical protein